MSLQRDYHNGTAKQSVLVDATVNKIWGKIRNVGQLSWVAGVKKTTYLSKQHRGVGVTREIYLKDDIIKECIVGWKENSYISYIAISGLPLRTYHATISIKQQKTTSKITWESYFNSTYTDKEGFIKFVEFLNTFYFESLKQLKKDLECKY